MIPNEANIHSLLVQSFDGLKADYGVYAEYMLGCNNGHAQYIEAVHDVLTVLFGSEQADRIYDAARMEAML